MKVLLCLLILFTPLIITYGQDIIEPIIDGVVSDEEWDEGYSHPITLNNGKILNLTIIFSDTHAYFLAKINHSDPGDQIILDVEVRHDYFGILFDNNKDGVVDGTQDSPDDLVMVDYIDQGGTDMFMHSFTAFDDLDNGGEKNVIASTGIVDGCIFWEISKELQSNDDEGHDIALSLGDEFHIMVAFWDDRFPHTTSSAVNEQKDNQIFLPITIPDPSAISNGTSSIQSKVSSSTTSSSTKQIIGFHASFVLLGIFVKCVSRRNRST